MGDMGDIFRGMKEHNKEKRAGNTERSTALLEEKGIEFESHNYGAHLVVIRNAKPYADFWPSTGKFKVRTRKNYQRGVFNLLKAMNDLGGINGSK